MSALSSTASIRTAGEELDGPSGQPFCDSTDRLHGAGYGRADEAYDAAMRSMVTEAPMLEVDEDAVEVEDDRPLMSGMPASAQMRGR